METNCLDGNETIKRVSTFSFSQGADAQALVIDTTYFIQDAWRLARLKEERADALRLFTTNDVLVEIAEVEERMSSQQRPKIPWRAFRNVAQLLDSGVVERLSPLESSCSEDAAVLVQEQDVLKKLQRGLEKTLYIEELEKEKALLILAAQEIVQLTRKYDVMRVAAHRYLERTERTTGFPELDHACDKLRQGLVTCYRQAKKTMADRFQEIHYSLSGSFAYAPYLEAKSQERRDLVAFLTAGIVQTLFRVVLDEELRQNFSFYTRLEKNSTVDRGILCSAYMLVPRTIPEGPIAVATHDNDIMSLIELRQCTTLRYTNGISAHGGI